MECQKWNAHCSVAKLCLTLCDPIACQMAVFPVLQISPRVCSNSYLLSWWYYSTITFSVALFSSCPQSFQASGSFPMSQMTIVHDFMSIYYEPCNTLSDFLILIHLNLVKYVHMLFPFYKWGNGNIKKLVNFLWLIATDSVS